MECPVCFSDDQSMCKLVCGHSICHDCTKSWYMKNTSEDGCTCPMCRKPLYFFGMRSRVGQWEEEREQAQYDNIYSKMFDNIIYTHMNRTEEGDTDSEYDFDSEWEYDSDDLMEDLADFEKKINSFPTDLFSAYDEDGIMFLLEMDMITETQPTMYIDTFFKNMFVSKHIIRRVRVKGPTRGGYKRGPSAPPPVVVYIEFVF